MSNFFLCLHILAGFIALLVGLIAIFAPKTTTVHQQSGRIYFVAMLVVALTSTIISLLSNPINYFLLVVGIFSFYLTFTGYRAVQLKNTPPQFIDKATTLLMLFTTLIMAGLAAYDWTYGNGQLSIILGIFGGIGGTLTISDLLVYANGLPHPREWMLRYLGRMLGAYVATLTAFVVTNFKGLVPRIYLWTVPTIIGASSILLLIQYYRKVYHIPTRQQQKVDSIS